MPRVDKPVVVKDAQWLQVVRQMPCWMQRYGAPHKCGHTIGKGPSEASHLQGKSNDGCVLPMCGGVHRVYKHSWHSGKHSFAAYYGTSVDELIAAAEQMYKLYKEGQ